MPSNVFIQVIHNGVLITVEMGCTSCAFGALDDEYEPCATCYRISTMEGIPYSQWLFDPSYDTGDGDTTPHSSGALPQQQKIGFETVAEAVSTLRDYSGKGDVNVWNRYILQFIIELQKLQQDELIPAPSPEMSDTEMGRWLIMLQQHCRQLELQKEFQQEQRKPSAGAVPPGQQQNFDMNKPISQQPVFGVESLPETTMTGEEIRAILRDEIYRLEKLQKETFADLQKLPKTREDAVTSAIYELVPAWLKHDEKGEEIDTADKKCQNRENAWKAANRGWTYQPPFENPTLKDKLLGLIRSADETAWQAEGANLKEWRGKIDRVKEKYDQERRQIQTETNTKAPQINLQADKLMAQHEALSSEQNRITAFVQQMRKVYQGFPKGDEPFAISAGCDAISLISDIRLMAHVEDRKNQEREFEKVRSKGQDITGSRKR